MSLEHVAVIGAGQMGSGIAQVFASVGSHPVTLIDISQECLDRGRQGIESSLEKLVRKGRMTDEVRGVALDRLTYASDIDAAAGAQLVVEAVPEIVELKRTIFTNLDHVTGSSAILASNTSSLSITSLGALTSRPDRVIGMHFMNPVPLMTLVEIIRGLETSDETVSTVIGWCEKLGKTPIEVRDFPGFVSNRVLLPMLNEAIQTVHEGVATPDAVDRIMKLGMNHPVGPIALADFIGLDTCLSIMEVLHRELGDDKYRPSPLLRKMVEAGRLGKKSGRGFYDYRD
ncbi:MAG: 3-hydroxybutyryl-CoA dehydrogenase [Planctomycetota bacterium]|jgi:3-hydroxybutyryl-CoA dehydrogenase|nr:3-hydroxybutyryl-CoA dehydrogenase [Planctomycetota bacterium]